MSTLLAIGLANAACAAALALVAWLAGRLRCRPALVHALWLLVLLKLLTPPLFRPALPWLPAEPAPAARAEQAAPVRVAEPPPEPAPEPFLNLAFSPPAEGPPPGVIVIARQAGKSDHPMGFTIPVQPRVWYRVTRVPKPPPEPPAPKVEEARET